MSAFVWRNLSVPQRQALRHLDQVKTATTGWQGQISTRLARTLVKMGAAALAPGCKVDGRHTWWPYDTKIQITPAGRAALPPGPETAASPAALSPIDKTAAKSAAIGRGRAGPGQKLPQTKPAAVAPAGATSTRSTRSKLPHAKPAAVSVDPRKVPQRKRGRA